MPQFNWADRRGVEVSVKYTVNPSVASVHSKAGGVFTCLCCSNKSSVALVVLPVNIKVGALGEGDDHVHVAMVARHNQAGLKHKNEAVWVSSSLFVCDSVIDFAS